MEKRNEIGSIRENAEYPFFSIESLRLRSFEDWPKALKQKPEQLADAGFFYLQISDRVVCFSCGGGLRAWEDEDDPWEQHALYYGGCQYMRLIKGNDYRDEAIAKIRRAEENKQKTSATNCASSDVAPTIDTPTNNSDPAYENLAALRKCKICFENESNSVFLSCGHIIACVKCASSLDVCPVCKRRIEKIIKVYFS